MMYYLKRIAEWLAPPFLILIQMLFTLVWLYCKFVDTQYATIWRERMDAVEPRIWLRRLYMPICIEILLDELYELYRDDAILRYRDDVFYFTASDKEGYDNWMPILARHSPLAIVRTLRNYNALSELTAKEVYLLLDYDNPIYERVDARVQVQMAVSLSAFDLFDFNEHLKSLGVSDALLSI